MRKNKKANVYEEEILAIISIIFIAFVLFMSSKFVIQTNEDINKLAPELSYQFPAVAVHSFLMTQIKESDVENLGLDIKNKYFIKDLLKINTVESLNIIETYKTEYLKILEKKTTNGNNPLYYYNEYSKESVTKTSLLNYQPNLDSITTTLEDAIEDKNYFFYFKTFDNKYVKVNFKD